jgi:hypothetical protein
MFEIVTMTEVRVNVFGFSAIKLYLSMKTLTDED